MESNSNVISDQEVTTKMSKITVTRKTSAGSTGSTMFTIDENNKQVKTEANQKGFSEKLEMKRDMLRKQRSKSNRRLLSRNHSQGRLDSTGRLDSMGSSASQYDNNSVKICSVKLGFRCAWVIFATLYLNVLAAVVL